MPHVIIEHSANVSELVDVRDLVAAVHEAALATGIAAVDALRTRAASRDMYEIGDGHHDNAFVAVTARLGAGRTDDEKRRLIDALMDAVETTLGDEKMRVMLSVEYQDIDPALRRNENQLRPVIAGRLASDDDKGSDADGR